MTTEIELLSHTRARLSAASPRYHESQATTLQELAGTAIAILKSYGFEAEMVDMRELSLRPPKGKNSIPPLVHFDLREICDSPSDWNLQYDRGLQQWFGPTEVVAGQFVRVPGIDTLLLEMLNRAKF